MKISKSKINNIIFLVIIALFLIPQTRLPIQVFLQKGLALFSPSTISKEKQVILKSYDWKLKSLDGTLFNFEETKGKVVLLNFWATWCPPCIAEMPSLHRLHNDYKDKIVFVLVSNENPETINNFFDDKDYIFKVYNASSNPPEPLKFSSIPRTFLIDKKGHVIIDKNGAANWNSNSVRNTIDNLLKK